MKIASSILSLFCLTAISSQAAISVQSFGIGTTDAQEITSLGTVIGANASLADRGSALNASGGDIRFIRHIVSVEPDICFYWFRADGDPTQYRNTEQWPNVYWYVADSCEFVDGATYGSDNFVLLHSASSNKIVGVLQYELTDTNYVANAPRLLAWAVDPEGLTFAQGVAAIQGVPEPSAAALALIAGTLAGVRRRRMDTR